VLDYIGLPPPGPLAGQSLRPQLVDPTRPGKGTATTIVVHRETHGRTVRTPEWRYTEWSDGTAELYDETRDPEETRNVAADPANIPVIARLKAQLPAEP
jgi:iduronate 2-sulfatase